MERFVGSPYICYLRLDGPPPFSTKSFFLEFLWALSLLPPRCNSSRMGVTPQAPSEDGAHDFLTETPFHIFVAGGGTVDF